MATAEAATPVNGTQLTPAAPQKSPILAGNRGLELKSFDDFWRFATVLSASGLAPKGMEKPESIMIALQMGAELGLSAMASVQNIAVINGRPGVWGDSMLGICRASGVFDEEAFSEEVTGDGDKMIGRVTVRRLPRGKAIQQEFSVDDAKKAGLWGKAGPWTQYPKRMLKLRARSFALRDAFADILRGFPCAEEVQDYIDAEPVRASLPKPEKKTLETLTNQFSQGEHADESHQGDHIEDVDQSEAPDPLAELAEAHPLFGLPTLLKAADTLGRVNTIEAQHTPKETDPEIVREAKRLSEIRREQIRNARGEGSNK